MSEIIVLWSWYIVSYKYIWIFKYMVLVPSDLMHEIIPLVGICELCTTLSWRKPPLESQFRYWLRFGSCVLRFHGRSHFQSSNSKISNWDMGHACYAFVVRATSRVLIPLYWPLWPVTNMPTWIWLLPGYYMDMDKSYAWQ